MMIKALLAAFFSSIVLMIWGSVFWMATPLPNVMLKKTSNEDAILTVLQTNLPASGVYALPQPKGEDFNDPAFIKKYQQGPIAQIFYRNPGVQPMSKETFLLGWLHNFICSLLISWLTIMALPGLMSYVRRVGFILLTAVFASVSIELLDTIWWNHVWIYHLMNMLEYTVGWFLASLVIAKIIKPAQRALF